MAMQTPTATGSDDAQGQSPQGAGSGPGLLGTAQGLVRDLRAVANARLSLAALEAQRAGRALATILACGIAAGALVVLAWLSLMGALVLWSIEHQVAPSGALLVSAMANLLALFAVRWLVRTKSRALGFPATLASLTPPNTLQTAQEPQHE